jgi:Zn-dependent protease
VAGWGFLGYSIYLAMPNIDIGQFILQMVALIFSISLHEAGHAWMSSRFGDDLARSQGRVSLNPMVHVDPIGTLLFPAIGFFTGAPVLGWARPTPVNPLRWRNKRVANLWVSAAGIICNLMLAIVAGVVLRALFETGVLVRTSSYLAVNSESDIVLGGVKLLHIFFTLNISLAIFNLVPVPPLDGSKILASILPPSFEPAIESLDRFGFLLLIILIYTRALNPIFTFFVPLAERIVFLGT